jgi:hypothetical protein
MPLSTTLFNAALANASIKDTAAKDTAQLDSLQKETNDLFARFSKEMSENFRNEVQKVIESEVRSFQKQILASIRDGELNLQQGVSGLLQQLAHLGTQEVSGGFLPSGSQQAGQFLDVLQWGQGNR